MSTWRHLFTVMTPTYNRAQVLQRVYESLCAQTCQDFEWIVVDDGSADNTRERVLAWQQESRFPIHYLWQENQHKKTAFNLGVRHACGEWLVALDSDDTLEPDALEAMAQVHAGIPETDRGNFIGIIGLCARPDGSIVGDMFPSDVFDATSLDLNFKYRITGEKFGCMRTHVLRQFPFPENIPGFVPESLVWRAIARAGYLNRFVNQVFRIYYDSPDSISRQGRDSSQHALGLWLLARDTVVECLPWFRYAPTSFMMAAARYTRFRLQISKTDAAIVQQWKLRGALARALVGAMAPVGWALYLRDRARL